MAVADEDAAGAGAEREDVAGAHEVAGLRMAARQHPERGGAVGGGDPGGHPVGRGRVDGDGEGRLHGLGVVRDHLREFETVELVGLHGRADETAALAHHERDDLGGRLLGGDDEVALVLPVLVVDDHHGPSGGDVANGLFDGVEREVLEGAVVQPGGLGSHAVAPSRAGVRVRSHQSRMPHRTRAP